MENLYFSFFDSRIYSCDISPFSCYIVQRYTKDRGWCDRWCDKSKLYVDVRDAILEMRRLIVAEYEDLKEGDFIPWRVICRTEVPVMFNWNTTGTDLRDQKEV